MKDSLIKALHVMQGEDVFIVKMLHYTAIPYHAEIWFCGRWLKFVNCGLVRTLHHLTLETDLGERLHYEQRANTFLVKLG